MSDVINSIFGRPKNENTGSGGYAYGTVEPAPEVAEAPAESAPETDEAGIVVEETESAPEAEAATETAEDEAVDSDQAEDDSDDESEEESGEDAAEATETSDEDVTGTDEEAVAEDDTDANVTAPEAVAEAEPVVEAEPVAEAVEAEPVAAEAAPVVAAEPVAEADAPAARPAAGNRGSTTIADGVVGKIVVRIAAQTEGVYSVAEDGITVELADDVAWVTVPVVVEFGHAVKALGEQIRVAVIDAVEQYLGLDVEVVDVHVTDIHFPDAD
jgi:uncharacterized alkaline shock family protein YloU